MRSLVVVVLLVLAGCLGRPAVHHGNEVAPQAPSHTEALPTAPVVEDGHVGWTASPGAAKTVLWYNATLDTDATSWVGGTADPDGSLYVAVPSEARGLVVELAWADSKQDLDLVVVAPGWCPSGSEPDVVGAFVCNSSDLVVAGGDRSGAWHVEGGLPGAGDTPIRFVLGADQLAKWGCSAHGDRDCTWVAWTYSRGVIVNLPITWAVTVFADQEPPTDYHLL